jgi:hypothetical protein
MIIKILYFTGFPTHIIPYITYSILTTRLPAMGPACHTLSDPPPVSLSTMPPIPSESHSHGAEFTAGVAGRGSSSGLVGAALGVSCATIKQPRGRTSQVWPAAAPMRADKVSPGVHIAGLAAPKLRQSQARLERALHVWIEHPRDGARKCGHPQLRQQSSQV